MSIINTSACASCHSKGTCSVSDMKEKIIEIPNNNGNYTVGQEVNVTMTKKQGDVAVLYSYALPLVVLITTIIIASKYANELITGLLALGAIAVYFLIIYFFRNKISNKFQFTISELD